MDRRITDLSRAKKFNLDRIVKDSEIDNSAIERCKIDQKILESIYNDYNSNQSMLKDYEKNILTVLSEEVMPHCNSIRSRIKSPDHLIAKIIRNSEEKGGKYLTINSDNYLYRITDLLGIRIIILRQKDWLPVHNTVLGLFENNVEMYVTDYGDDDYEKNHRNYDGKKYIAEKPVVYITSENDRNIYENIDTIDVKRSNRVYRSIHYIIHYEEIYFEIQVRTIFEEGWLEFDHAIQYPNDTKNPIKKEYLQVLNYISVAADSLISFYDKIEPVMNEKKRPKNNSDKSKNIDNEVDNKKISSFENKLLKKF